MKNNSVDLKKLKRAEKQPARWMSLLGVGLIVLMMITGVTAYLFLDFQPEPQPEHTHNFNPSTLLYLAERNGRQQIHLYDVEDATNQALNVYMPHGESPDKVVWQDGQYIVSVAKGSRILKLDLNSGDEHQFSAHTGSFINQYTFAVGSLDWCTHTDRFVITGSGVSADFGWVEALNRSGKQIEKVSDRSGYTDIACSPDGTSVAVVDTIRTSGMLGVGRTNQSQNKSLGRISEDKDIYLATMSLSGGKTTQLTDDGFAIQPDWSPDGTRLAFVGRFDNDSTGKQIYQIELATKKKQALTNFTEDDISSPVWSSDGEKIAFVKDGDIWFLQVSTGELTQVTQTPEQESAPVWHP